MASKLDYLKPIISPLIIQNCVGGDEILNCKVNNVYVLDVRANFESNSLIPTLFLKQSLQLHFQSIILLLDFCKM